MYRIECWLQHLRLSSKTALTYELHFSLGLIFAQPYNRLQNSWPIRAKMFSCRPIRCKKGNICTLPYATFPALRVFPPLAPITRFPTFGTIFASSTAWLAYMPPQLSALWFRFAFSFNESQTKIPIGTKQSMVIEPLERPYSCQTCDFMELFEWLLCDFLIDAFRFLR